MFRFAQHDDNRQSERSNVILSEAKDLSTKGRI
jgi:hypothetical protein